MAPSRRVRRVVARLFLAGHLDVHQDQVVVCALGRFTILGRIDGQIGESHQVYHDLPVQWVVLVGISGRLATTTMQPKPAPNAN